MAVPRRTISSKPSFGFCFCVKVSIAYCPRAPFGKITNGANNVANRAPGPIITNTVRLQNQTQFIPKMQKNESPEKRCNSGTCGLKAKKGKQITDVPIALTRKLMLHLGRHKLSHLPFANDFYKLWVWKRAVRFLPRKIMSFWRRNFVVVRNTQISWTLTYWVGGLSDQGNIIKVNIFS